MVTSQPWKVDFKEENEEDNLKIKTWETGHGFEDDDLDEDWDDEWDDDN